jgi:nucleotide-binding universal stress UspA family protein
MNRHTPLPRTILLATDGSPDSRMAARAAADLAIRGGVSLHAVHAWEAYGGFTGMAPVASPLLDQDSARAILADEVAYLHTQHVDVAGTHLRMGSPAAEILAVATEIAAGLIVVGSRGLGTVRRTMLGSVSEHVVHHAHVPVLVMRGPANAWPPNHVVVGDDATPDAVAVLPLAGEIAGLFGARVTLVHALTHLEQTLREENALTANVVDDILEFAQGELEDHAATLSDDVRVRTSIRVAVDEPAGALLDIAARDQGHALVVVGTRGFGPIGRLRFGSVSTAVLRNSRGPVLIGAHGTAVPLRVVRREEFAAS